MFAPPFLCQLLPYLRNLRYDVVSKMIRFQEQKRLGLNSRRGMKHSEMLVVKIMDDPEDSSPCPCLLPTGSPEYFAFIQQKVASLKTALEKAYPRKTRMTYINLQDNPAEQASAEGQLLVNKKLCAPLVLIDGEPRFSGIILA